MNRRILTPILAALALSASALTANAENIAVGNYGVSANGMPFWVALAQG